MNLWNLLCRIGIHHVPDEKRRTAHGICNARTGRLIWLGDCTRCDLPTFGQIR